MRHPRCGFLSNRDSSRFFLFGHSNPIVIASLLRRATAVSCPLRLYHSPVTVTVTVTLSQEAKARIALPSY